MQPRKNTGREYRFFFHYRKHEDGMSVHFRNKCYPVDLVDCHVRNVTKRNKTQPRVVQQGFATAVVLITNRETNAVIAHIV